MSAPRPLDFRSDTVTRPDAQMRAAMAAAEVGDDVLDRDPTMRTLEERAADLLGVEAALWVPSGSMGNLVALCVQLRPGDRFIAPAQAHVLEHEAGTPAWIAGGMPHALPWDAGAGRITPEAFTSAASTVGPYYALRTSLLCLENTHGGAGGCVVPVEEYTALVNAAREVGVRVHLDGARIWHAAVALGVKPAELTRGADTVQACLSKGLGAPVGSVVGGSTSFVEEARRVRKMLGGGVRQGGILAAAGLIALERIGRLDEDHVLARRLAEGLAELGLEVPEPETNIVMARVEDAVGTVARLAEAGVRCVPVGSGRIRFVTHRDIAPADIPLALERIATLPV